MPSKPYQEHSISFFVESVDHFTSRENGFNIKKNYMEKYYFMHRNPIFGLEPSFIERNYTYYTLLHRNIIGRVGSITCAQTNPP